MNRGRILIALALVGLSVASCKKEPIEFVEFETPVPATYSFDNVNYQGQLERLDQLTELMEYVETANGGSELDVAVMRAMFANTNGNANGNFSFTSTKNLRDKCFEPFQATMDEYFVAAANSSKSTAPASEGVAGIMTSQDGSTKRLFDANGFEHSELIEKSMMGAVFYYQATGVYLEADKMDVDNEEVVEGEGTAMEHHWDEAYGYLGVTNDFPVNTEDVYYWGKYCVGRDALINSVDSLSHAFRAGRAAIVVERYDERDAAIAKVRKHWENVCAATAIHYINDALENLDDDMVRNHVLSEAYAFIQNLFYNPESRLESTEIDALLALIGDNLYQVNSDDLMEVRDRLADTYEFDGIKSAL